MVRYTIAESANEKQKSNALVTKIYHGLGYIPENDSEYFGKISNFIFKPTSVTILATDGASHDLLGTASLVLDDPDGIPMDNIFNKELAGVRSKCDKIAEVCQFAVERDGSVKPRMDVSLGLLSHLLFVTKQRGVGCLCFTVHTKHKPFYEMLGCKILGETKTYPSVNDNPAVPFYLDMSCFFSELETKPAFIRDPLLTPPTKEFQNQTEQMPDHLK